MARAKAVTAMGAAFENANVGPIPDSSNTSRPAQPTQFSLKDLINNVRSSKLSSDGEAYIRFITEKLESKFQIESITTMNSEALLIYKQTKTCRDAVLLIFADSSAIDDSQNHTVSHQVVTSIVNKLSKDYANWNWLQHITIKEVDYPRVDRMVTTIINTLTPSNRQLTIGALRANDHLIFKADRLKAARAIDAESPHAVPARADLGFTIEIANKTETVNGPVIEPILIAAATGYVEFRRLDLTSSISYVGSMNMLPYQYQPVVVISDMISMISDINIFPYLIAGIYDAWITARGWCKPFKQFGKIDRNMGNLIVEKNKMKECPCLEALYEVINNHIKPPILCIDMPEGRAKIKNLNALILGSDTLAKVTGDFLGISNIQSPFFGMTEEQVIGFYKQGNELHDTRELDALQLAIGIKNPSVLELTKPALTPTDRIAFQKEMAGNVEPVYYNRRLEFNNSYLHQVHQAIMGCNVFNQSTADYGVGQQYQEQQYISMFKPMINPTVQGYNMNNYYNNLA